MRRTTTLRRTKPLRRTTALVRKTPLARVGKKTRRERSAWARCKSAVRKRSGGLCEICHLVDEKRPTGKPVRRGAVACHHVWPEDRAAGRHDPDRCLDVCWQHHAWAHDNPTDAGELGVLRPNGHDDILWLLKQAA